MSLDGRLHDLYREVVKEPRNDEYRQIFADAVESTEIQRGLRTSTMKLRARKSSEDSDRKPEYSPYEYPGPRSEDLPRWLNELIPGDPRRSVPFNRGFPSWWGFGGVDDFLENAPFILAETTIRGFEFWRNWEVNDAGRLHEVLEHPLMNVVESLDLREATFQIPEYAQFATCRNLQNLYALNLVPAGLSIEEKFIEMLMTSPSLPRLVRAPYLMNEFGVVEEYRDPNAEPEGHLYVFSPKGKELEQQLGYIPFIHDEGGGPDSELWWYVEHGVLPRIPKGTKPPQASWYPDDRFEETFNYKY